MDSTNVTRLGRSFLTALAIAAALILPMSAQQAVSTTTVAGAVGATDTTATVASGSGVGVGWMALIDREIVRVTAVSSNTLTVSRAQGGLSGTHTVGALVYYGPPTSFQGSDPPVGCNSSQTAAPYINQTSGRVWICNNLNTWIETTGQNATAGTFLVGTGPTTASSSTAGSASGGQFVGSAANNVSAPPFTFSGDTGTGVGSQIAGSVDLVSGRTTIAQATGTFFRTTVPLFLPDGTAAAPSLTFASQNTLGVFKAGSGIFGLTNKTVIGLLGTESQLGDGILFLKSDLSNSYASTTLRLRNVGAAGQGFVTFDHLGGTEGALSTVPANTIFGSVVAVGYNGTSMMHGSEMLLRALNQWSGSDNSSYMTFYTVKSGDTAQFPTLQLGIDGAGSANFLGVADATGAANVGSLTTLGGLNVAKAAFVGTTITMGAGASTLNSTQNKLVQIGDSTAAVGVELNVGTPSLGTCTGGSLVSGGKNTLFEVTGNTSGSCVVNFGTPIWQNAPLCFVNDETALIAVRISARTTNAITVTGAGSGDAFQVYCLGRVGT